MDVRTRNFSIGLVLLGAAAVALWFGEADAEERARMAESRITELTRRAITAEVAAREAIADAKARGDALGAQTLLATTAAKRAGELEASLAAALSELAETKARLGETEKARTDAAARVNELNAEVEAAASAIAELNAKVTELEKAKEAAEKDKAKE